MRGGITSAPRGPRAPPSLGLDALVVLELVHAVAQAHVAEVDARHARDGEDEGQRHDEEGLRAHVLADAGGILRESEHRRRGSKREAGWVATIGCERLEPKWLWTGASVGRLVVVLAALATRLGARGHLIIQPEAESSRAAASNT